MQIIRIHGLTNNHAAANNKSLQSTSRALRNDPYADLFFGSTFTRSVAQKQGDVGFPAQAVAADKVLRPGTAGFRPGTLTEGMVKQFLNAYADYVVEAQKTSGKNQPVLVCWDTRESSRQFYPLAADILRARGIDVLLPETPLSTPLSSFAAKHHNVFGVINLTASHNPYQEGGIKILDGAGVNANKDITNRIETLQEKPANAKLTRTGQISRINPVKAYLEALEKSGLLDFDAIKKSGINVVIDPQYGTGKPLGDFLQAKGVQTTGIGTDTNPPKGFNLGSEPIAANLGKLIDAVKSGKNDAGLATDCDADRFGLVDEKGNLISSNDVLALTLDYLVRAKNKDGIWVRNQATSHFLDDLYTQLTNGKKPEIIETPVGFKYVGNEIENRRSGGRAVVLGGESSGGGTSGFHVVSEKDGMFMNAMLVGSIADAKGQGKTISQALQALKDNIPTKYAYTELAVTVSNDAAKGKIEEAFAKLQKDGGKLGGLDIDKAKSEEKAKALESSYKTRDGVKLYLDDGSWCLVRLSGTEPKIRVYIEGVSKADTKEAEARKSAIQNDVMDKLKQADANLKMSVQQ